MRVTQNMLTNANLSYISKNYERLGKLQDQINTGKKITRPSDDPVVAMKGMRYRSQLVEVKQFTRNLTEGYTWLETSDSALEEAGQVLHRIRELTVQASNDSYDKGARDNIAKEITQLQEHLVAMANTKVGDNYIFNGTDTDNPPVNDTGFDIEISSYIDDINTVTPPTTDDDVREDYIFSYQGQTYKYDKDRSDANNAVYIVEPEIKYIDVNPDTEVETEKTGPIASLTINKTDGTITKTFLEKQENLNGGMIEVQKEFKEKDKLDLVISKATAVSTNDQDVEIEVMKGVNLAINVRANKDEPFAFSADLFGGIESIKKMLQNPDTTGQEITKALDSLDRFTDDVVSTRAELGARLNRVEMIEDRLLKQRVVAEQTVSDNEDVHMEEAIIDLTIQESIHRASLAVGARIIQPTLMDFLR